MQKIIKRRPKAENRFSDVLPPLLQQIYSARGIASDEDIQTDLSGLLTPQSLKGLPEAIDLLVTALEQQQRLLVVGDFDADGATSSALAVLALTAMGAESVNFLVPNRFEYGYGLTPEIVAVATQFSPDLIITVDNGISSIDGVKAANDAGIKVLVTDHHLPGTTLPAAAAIVNPNQPGCHFDSKNLAGVGVIFYLMSALRSALRERQWFAQRQIQEPAMADYLDLVALGTVADVVPLDKNNRILVAQGIRRIRAGRTRPGIKALLAVGKRNAERLVSSDLGFAVGPRLNAAGRLDDMTLGIQCLLSDDPYQAGEIARQMDELNQDRKSIEGSMQREAMQSLKALKVEEGNMPYGLCLYDANWHQGVIGILASRIKDRYHRPVIVFADADEEGVIKGSARSISGLHIRDALDAVASRHPGLLSKFGGHAMAAGMSLAKDQYPLFEQAFDEEVRRQLSDDDLQAVLASDGALAADSFNLELAQLLRDAGPWGQHFPEPLFDGEFLLVQQRILQDKHLKLVLALEEQPQQPLDAIAFNVDMALWKDQSIDKVRLVYKLDVNEFRGNQTLQLMVEYIEPLL
ncbi:single-stranded-DNA-specific exonuclease RecJ [Oceanicoccus sagamiensis]|uniref:Single-stranded-DNA-specific exonuclease RecJ n=1 Tax=Oceanicoccus sagamiensis TaxID=716816 RepID=A0A1X9NBI2_9GAMM|nr:single-stranded-DNA-specific exonuclease RecJ [Oceanicoccus sagamiensis]ARN75398.1 single-stranded-DNA-specific exonuclease RecJ [Oceanicoccus sagamiensis]